MAKKKEKHLIEELESKFQSLHGKIVRAKDNYLKSHEKELNKASRAVKSIQAKLIKTKKQVVKAAATAKKSGSKKAHDEVVKAKATAALLGNSLHEAKVMMTTSQSKLKTAKQFQKKLAARAKALDAFEKSWEQKMKAEAASAAKRAAAARKKRASVARPKKT